MVDEGKSNLTVDQFWCKVNCFDEGSQGWPSSSRQVFERYVIQRQAEEVCG